MKHGSLFSGIGGFDLAAEWMGWDNVFHCEINPFGQKILKYYWPDAITYSDITKTDFSIHRGKIDVLTGGFPCQPYSLAGKRKGTEDERHLWPEMLRAIREINPVWIVGENVFGIVNWDGGVVFEHIQADMEAEGYEVQPYVLPACGVNAPHRRDRVWFVAHAGLFGQKKRRIEPVGTEQLCEERAASYSSNSGTERMRSGRENEIYKFNTSSNPEGIENIRDRQRGFYSQSSRIDEKGASSNSQETECKLSGRTRSRGKGFTNGDQEFITADTRCGERKNWLHGKESGREATEFGNDYTKFGAWTKFPIIEPTIRSRNDGLSSRLDGITVSKHRNESIKAYGNAVVPELVFQIFKSIQGYEKHKR